LEPFIRPDAADLYETCGTIIPCPEYVQELGIMILLQMPNKQAAKALKRFTWLGRVKAGPPWHEMMRVPEIGCFFFVWGLLAG
jgi:hypothetical protein